MPINKLLRIALFLFIIQYGFTGCRGLLNDEQAGDKPDPMTLREGTSFRNADNYQPLKRDTTYGRPDFVSAARNSIPAVVHIKTRVYNNQQGYNSLFGRLYDRGGGSVAIGSGSGISISSDGYIATNNHVIENASEIEVIFPNRSSYQAKLVGTDPNTDVALLKIEAQDLPVIRLGNSDDVEVGEWVLAVGYPLSLNSTVTAGIISAKGRSIGIINQTQERNYRNPVAGNTAVESFLQTDAAINPGNSGGALVNTNGELIGINTAIASQTGSYSGYAFAIPVNLAIKILDDLKNYGEVRRGVLGVSFPSPSVEDEFLKQQGFDPGSISGVYIMDIQKGSAAEAAGLRRGDFIQEINEIPVGSSSELSEQIARHHPGDKIELTYLRNGKTNTANVTLKGAESIEAGQSVQEIYERLGAVFSPISAEIKNDLNISSGMLVTDVKAGGFFDRIGIPAGTIIVMINNKPVNTPAELEKNLLTARRGLVRMLAIAPDGSRVVFSFSLGT